MFSRMQSGSIVPPNAASRNFDIRAVSPAMPAGALSGGNQQKLLLAKTMLTQPRIIIIDEPTRGIDIGTKQQIYRFVRRLADEGTGVIVISSELPEVLRLSHRIAVMCEGRLTGILPGGASQEAIMELATQREGAAA